ncbi:MAG: ComF family protein [Gammaproteobacteria bacterium]|nr:ComF family protein [Gammaproteobacteria bacterium]
MSSFLDLLFPRICVLCKAPSKRDFDLCLGCEHELPHIKFSCEQCGLPLAVNQAQCGSCLTDPPAFNATKSLFFYEAPIDSLVLALKFNNNLLYANLFGELLALHLQGYYHNRKLPEVIIPVPLHRDRLRERGYNQALEIARPVAKKLNIQINKFSCVRFKNTLQQSALAFSERKQNIKDAFAVVKPLHAKYVAIIDDVVTTGYTVNEFSKSLRQAGAEKIDVWCVARTPQKNNC